MGCIASKPEESRLSLPQNVTGKAAKDRADAVAEAAKAYHCIQAHADLPPWCKSVPSAETTASGVVELLKVFYRLEKAVFDVRWENFKARLAKSEYKDKPFGRFYGIFELDGNPTTDNDALPWIAYDANKKLPAPYAEGGNPAVWMTDEELGWQHTNGLMPHFIQLVRERPAAFEGLDPAVLAPLLPTGMSTLDEAIAAKRVFLSDVCETLEGIPPKPDTNHVITVPVCLFIVGSDNRIRPAAIKLFRSQADAPIFTANQEHTPPNLWLGVKTHLMCAEFQIHTLLVHALTEHLMMEPIWATLCSCLSPRHPLHEMMKPHMWNMVLVNPGVRDSLMEDYGLGGAVGALQENLQAGKASADVMKKMYAKLDYSREGYFNIPERYKQLGLGEAPAEMPYWFRDETLELWGALHKMALDFVKGLYADSDAMLKDTELQAWCKALGRRPTETEQGADVRNFPHNAKAGVFDSHEDLALFITMVLYQCSVRHSHVENSAVYYYTWVPLYPAAFDLPVPTTHDEIELEAIDRALPDERHTVSQVSLIQSVHVHHDEVRVMTSNDDGFLEGAPQGCVVAHETFMQELMKIDRKMVKDYEARANMNVTAVPFLRPTTLAQSIWN